MHNIYIYMNIYGISISNNNINKLNLFIRRHISEYPNRSRIWIPDSEAPYCVPTGIISPTVQVNI